MKALFAVLIVCGSAWAQEARFFEIPVAGDVTNAIATSDGGDVVHLFYNMGGMAYHLGFDTEQGTVVFPAHQIQVGNPYPRAVQSAEMLETGNWICVVTGYGSPLENPSLHQAWVVQGLDGQQFEEELFYEEIEDVNQFGTYGRFSDAHIVACPDSGYVIVGSKTGRMGPEPFEELFVYPIANGINGFGDQEMSLFPQMLREDTLEVMTVGNLGGTAYQRIDMDCESDCYFPPIFWELYSSLPMMTRGREILALYHSYLLRLNPDSTADTIATVDNSQNLWSESGDTHPEFGFAILTTSDFALQLARVDTLGDSPASFGTVGWNTTPYSATVNFASNGELLIAYGLGDSLLGLAVVPWDAPLDAPVDIEPLPTSFSLSAYPNPFNSSVTIEYEIAKAGDIELAVFNTLGQKVATLFEGNELAGKHSLSWSPNTTSGVYFVKLQANGIEQSRKMLSLR